MIFARRPGARLLGKPARVAKASADVESYCVGEGLPPFHGGNPVGTMPAICAEILLAPLLAGVLWLGGAVRDTTHRLVYKLAGGIVWFGLAACVVLAVIYLMQVFLQRPRR